MAIARALRAPYPQRLLVAGDGPERTALEETARRLGIADRVAFLGQIAHPEALFAELDLYALSSDTEQMPLGVLEAMAAGLPVAGVDVGDVKEMVALENRPFIVPRDDEPALAKALGSLVQDAQLRRAVGEANRRRAANSYPMKRMIDDYRRLFAETSSLARGAAAHGQAGR